MSSNEIVTLINALGTGSKDFNLENLRYEKIIIMMMQMLMDHI